MTKEIERKFLVDEEKICKMLDSVTHPCTHIAQVYMAPGVRLRISVNAYTEEEQVFLTVKSPVLEGTKYTRNEWEFQIPWSKQVEDVFEDESLPMVAKNRYMVDGFEVDHLPAIDLWLAEKEVLCEEEEFDKPVWLGEEVTDDPQYSNYSIAQRHPKQPDMMKIIAESEEESK